MSVPRVESEPLIPHSCLLLSGFALTQGPFCGYDLITSYDLNSGALYPVLHTAVETGLIEEVRAPDGYARKGPKARHFDLTGNGLEIAAFQLGRLQVPNLASFVLRKEREIRER